MTGNRLGLVGCCLLGLVALSAVSAAVDGYSISDDSAIETPTQTVEYEGQTYTIDSVTRITAGESVTLTTGVPAGATYNINLRGPENQLISSERKTGAGSHTFSYFGSGEAGTYAATIDDDGSTVAVHPIVIAGYDISLERPDTLETGGEVTISATVTERSVAKHSSLDRVEVVVGNDDVEIQKPLTRTSGKKYETTISAAELTENTYNVYVVVRGDETVRQRAEILAVSETTELTVTGETDTATDGSGDPGGTGGDGTTDGQSSTTPEQGTATPPGEPKPPGTETSPVPDTTTPSPGDPPTETESGTSQRSPAQNSGGDGAVIAPESQTATETSSGSGPGFTVVLTVVAVTIGLAVRRYD